MFQIFLTFTSYMYESVRGLAFSSDTWRGKNAFIRKFRTHRCRLIETKCRQSWEPFLSQSKAEGMKPLFVIKYKYISERWILRALIDWKRKATAPVCRFGSSIQLSSAVWRSKPLYRNSLKLVYLGQTTWRKSEKLTGNFFVLLMQLMLLCKLL